MTPRNLVDRLVALPNLAAMPSEELTWLAANGNLETHPVGAIVGPKGQRIRSLWIILSGRIGVRVDRGAGPKRVISWKSGEVTGMLPYSRMTGPPGDNYFEEPGELLTIHERHFPAMISRCPAFTAYTVHLMLDRARGFSASDLQDEKMLSLGKLAAGLAHELNNPASAIVGGSRILLDNITASDNALHALHAENLPSEVFEAIERVRSACRAAPGDRLLSPIQLADRADEIADWLAARNVNPNLAEPLAEAAITMDALEDLAHVAAGTTLDDALLWVVASCGERAMAASIWQAASRIFRLVDAVKRFTYMDKLSAVDAVDIEGGLRDTADVLAAKASSKGASVHLDIEAKLPRVLAAGAELNQVWFNLIDNALDAIVPPGQVSISAQHDGDRVVVRVVDNGPGIAPEIVSQIFDPFFTTKPPGQGVGLGLDIARRLVRRHQGDIAVRSVPGRTEFEVSLLTDPAERM